jgi:retron-type reverse transcriptase
MTILQENIRDNRFLRLLEGALKAGYCEEWTYHPSLSGSPQGGIVNPILSNIYLDRLDKFIEDTLIPEYTRGEKTGSESGIQMESQPGRLLPEQREPRKGRNHTEGDATTPRWKPE